VIPVDQSIMHAPENGIWGDCMRACIASLLDLPIIDVPHFFEGGCESRVFDQRVAAFLSTHGLMEIQLDPSYARYVMRQRRQPCYHLMYGDTERGTYHAVVGLSGKMVHDPHPSKAGIIENGNMLIAFLVHTGSKENTQ
jgi:hypothetical protein